MRMNHFNVPHARCETFWQRKIQSRSVHSRLLIFLGPGVPCTAATGHLVISKSAYQRCAFKYFILRSKNDTTSCRFKKYVKQEWISSQEQKNRPCYDNFNILETRNFTKSPWIVGIKSRRLFDLIMFQSLYRRTLVTQIFQILVTSLNREGKTYDNAVPYD
jgi:hypothetical protein